ncbi:unnamed protein product [Lampetra planeri]
MRPPYLPQCSTVSSFRGTRPTTSENFLFQTPKGSEEAARDWEDFEPSCASCSKAFKSLKAKESHDRSKKHRDNVAWLRQQMTAEEFAFLFGAGPQMLPSPTACTAPNQDTAAQTNGTADETAHCDHNARPDGHGAPWLEPTSEDSPGRGRPPGGTRDGGQERRGDGAHEEGGEACEERWRRNELQVRPM